MSTKKTASFQMPAPSYCAIYGHRWVPTLTDGVRVCRLCGKMGQCPTCRPALVLKAQIAYCPRHGEGL